jgi:TATA-box binding protein (TBP) (component of TFIID and TFIIIB)
LHAQGNGCRVSLEFDARRFTGLKLRRHEPLSVRLVKGKRDSVAPFTSVATLFASGKLTTTGARYEEVAQRSLRKYCRVIQMAGFPARFCDFEVKNYTANCDVGFDVELKDFARDPVHGRDVLYEPEISAAAAWLWDQGDPQLPGIKANVFGSGKVIFMGARSREAIEEAYTHLLSILRPFSVDFLTGQDGQLKQTEASGKWNAAMVVKQRSVAELEQTLPAAEVVDKACAKAAKFFEGGQPPYFSDQVRANQMPVSTDLSRATGMCK